MLVLISRPPGDNLIRLHTQASTLKCTHVVDTNHTQDLGLLALNTHHLHDGKSVLRSEKRVLGLENVFPMFIAIAYAAGGCKTLLMLSIISNSVIRRQLVFWGQSDGAEQRAESVLRGEEKQVNLC